jgi:ribosomal-protein-alanine N-acetyltransferase
VTRWEEFSEPAASTPARGGGVALRAYTPGDFAEIVALDRECFEPGVAYSNREMGRFLAFATRVAVVAERGGTIAGFCIGYLAPGRAGHIITLDVREADRRTGVGKALLEATIARLAKAGAPETLLEVDVANAAAIAFYERLGFQRAGEIPDYYGPGRPALRMSRWERKSEDRSDGDFGRPTTTES